MDTMDAQPPQIVCPRCGHTLPPTRRNTCLYCGQSLEGNPLLGVPHAQAGQAPPPDLGHLAPGWDEARLCAWVRSRPARIAWAATNHAWPILEGWVEASLWRTWESAESQRRASGQRTVQGSVTVDHVRPGALDLTRKRVQVLVQGSRASFVQDAQTGHVLSGLRNAKPFRELWVLEATGLPESEPQPKCRNCGAPMPMDTQQCPYCSSWRSTPGDAWRLVALEHPEDLSAALPGEQGVHAPLIIYRNTEGWQEPDTGGLLQGLGQGMGIGLGMAIIDTILDNLDS